MTHPIDGLQEFAVVVDSELHSFSKDVLTASAGLIAGAHVQAKKRILAAARAYAEGVIGEDEVNEQTLGTVAWKNIQDWIDSRNDLRAEMRHKLADTNLPTEETK